MISTLCTRKLKGHSTSVNKVQAGANRIVTVSDDQTVCIWYKKIVTSQVCIMFIIHGVVNFICILF